MKNKKIIIGAIAVFIVGFGVCSYFALSTTKKDNIEVENTLPKNEKPKIEEKIEYSAIRDKNGKILKGEDKEKALNSDVAIYEANKLIIGEGEKEFPMDKSKALLSQLKIYASNVDYEKIIETVNQYLKEYRFCLDTNQEIATMYNDSSLMLSTKTASDIQKGVIAKAMRNVEMKTVGALMLPEISRESLVKDQNSLDPIISGKVIILSNDVLNLNNMDSIKDEDKFIVKDIIENCDKLLSLNKVKIKVDKDYILNTYVITNMDNTIEIYGYYADKNQKTPYQTVKYWKKLNKELNKELNK